MTEKTETCGVCGKALEENEEFREVRRHFKGKCLACLECALKAEKQDYLTERKLLCAVAAIFIVGSVASYLCDSHYLAAVLLGIGILIVLVLWFNRKRIGIFEYLMKTYSLIVCRGEEKAKRYAVEYSGRIEDSDQFSSACGMDRSEVEKGIAIGIRECIAQLGTIDSKYVNSPDSFRLDLVKLPFWDSIDYVEIVLALESHFDIELSEAEVSRMIGPELGKKSYTVADAVSSWGRVIERKLSEKATCDGPGKKEDTA